MLQFPKHLNTMLFNYMKRSFFKKPYSSIYSKINQVTNEDINNKQFTPIFKTSHMQFFIGLNKFKKIQTVALFCFIPTCFGINMLGHLSIEEVIFASLVGSGLTVGLHISSWLISNNLVVIAYLSKDEKKCRMSYISYWGNRLEFYCDIEDIEPIQCSKFNVLNKTVTLKGSKHIFKLVTHNATIFNNAKCRKVFGSDVI